MTGPTTKPVSEAANDETAARPAVIPTPLRPEDFYFEGPYMVFTEAYHLRRGFCCNSDCRHCPYR